MHGKDRQPVLAGLRRRWGMFATLNAALLAAGALYLWSAWAVPHAGRWLLISSAVSAYFLWVLWRYLERNHRPDEEELLHGFGPGNWMTLARGLFLVGMSGFLFSPRPPGWLIWLPGVLYLLAVAADFLDGYLARISDHSTKLGEILDLNFDGLGVLASAALIVGYEQVPVWYLSVALARYLFAAGAWLRRRQGKPLYDLPPSISRRAFAGVQMGFIAVMLLPLFSPPGTNIAAAVFAFPFLAGFLKDWLIVSGVIPAHLALSENTRAFLVRWTPVLLRLMILILAAGPLARRLSAFAQGTAAQSALLIGLEILALLLLSLGAGGRIAAILALLLLGFQQMASSLTSAQFALIVAYTAVLFMGTGAFSLWTPENRLIYRRAGERVETFQPEAGA